MPPSESPIEGIDAVREYWTDFFDSASTVLAYLPTGFCALK